MTCYMPGKSTQSDMDIVEISKCISGELYWYNYYGGIYSPFTLCYLPDIPDTW